MKSTSLPVYDNTLFAKRATAALQDNGYPIDESRVLSLLEARDSPTHAQSDPQSALYETGKSQGFTKAELDVIDAAEYEYLAEIGAVTNGSVDPASNTGSRLGFLKEALIVLALLIVIGTAVVVYTSMRG